MAEQAGHGRDSVPLNIEQVVGATAQTSFQGGFSLLSRDLPGK